MYEASHCYHKRQILREFSARDISQTLGQRTISECTTQHWYQKFRTKDESLDTTFLFHNQFFKHLDNFQQKAAFNNQATAQNAFEELIGFRIPEFYAVRFNRLVSFS
ncbi:hypothetical protein NPIL_27461 [Nephila pilipes]|uniref:HTH_48 domain-containing protein n=1 Tax=Nephila pilipes TaxID=299642 RepID=A0A8X6PK80_NEPPI|nr:hypothetical protein NPIL_27461 [Nephila pilipes]